MKFETVTSTDGTTIAFERTGNGPPLLLVGGAFCDRTAPPSGTPLAALLAARFTVFSYDRRGRGDSGDVTAYAIDREIDDIAALLKAAGEPALVFGNSSGALLAFDVAHRGLPISKLCLYEPPVILDPARAGALLALAQQLDEAVRAGRRGDAVELYMTQVMQMPAAAFEQVRRSPAFSGLQRLAHTLSYDLAITARGAARLEDASAIRATTLVMNGEASPPWMRAAIENLARRIPGAQHRTLAGQTHAVDIRRLANALGEFFAATS
jgi:pimeloyl-ACP methyl ester carboxylesterase